MNYSNDNRGLKSSTELEKSEEASFHGLEGLLQDMLMKEL